MIERGYPRTCQIILIWCTLRQVNQATKLKAKAGRLQEEGSQLLDKASAEKGKAAELKVCNWVIACEAQNWGQAFVQEKYYKAMDEYGQAVKKIDEAAKGFTGKQWCFNTWLIHVCHRVHCSYLKQTAVQRFIRQYALKIASCNLSWPRKKWAIYASLHVLEHIGLVATGRLIQSSILRTSKGPTANLRMKNCQL